MLASSPRGPTMIPRRATCRTTGYGVGFGVTSAYEMRIHADCVGLRKYGGLRYLSRVS